MDLHTITQDALVQIEPAIDYVKLNLSGLNSDTVVLGALIAAGVLGAMLMLYLIFSSPAAPEEVTRLEDKLNQMEARLTEISSYLGLQLTQSKNADEFLRQEIVEIRNVLESMFSYQHAAEQPEVREVHFRRTVSAVDKERLARSPNAAFFSD